jgi:hypothetical protein
MIDVLSEGEYRVALFQLLEHAGRKPAFAHPLWVYDEHISSFTGKSSTASHKTGPMQQFVLRMAVILCS